MSFGTTKKDIDVQEVRGFNRPPVFRVDRPDIRPFLYEAKMNFRELDLEMNKEVMTHLHEFAFKTMKDAVDKIHKEIRAEFKRIHEVVSDKKNSKEDMKKKIKKEA